MPVVTIIIPLFNKKPYIIETIQSVLAQSFEGWELLIVDNGSIDGSLEEAGKVTDARIRLLSISSRGPSAARNHGLDLAKGEWIQFLDADDLLEPGHLAQMIKVATQNPQADIIACGWQEFADNFPSERVVKYPAADNTNRVLSDSAITTAPWAVHAAIIRRDILSASYYWPISLDKHLAEDIVFWFKLVSQFDVAYSESSTALYRVQTVGGRAEGPSSRRWFDGVQIAMKNNIEFLKTTEKGLTSGQCEYLMRAYMMLYQFSKANGFSDLSKGLYHEARKWFDLHLELSNDLKLSVLVRRVLGLRLFSDLQSCLSLIGK